MKSVPSAITRIALLGAVLIAMPAGFALAQAAQTGIGDADHCAKITAVEYDEFMMSACEGNTYFTNPYDGSRTQHDDNFRVPFRIENTCSDNIYFRYRDITGRVVDQDLYSRDRFPDAHYAMEVPCRLQNQPVKPENVYCADFTADFEPTLLTEDTSYGVRYYYDNWSDQDKNQYIEKYHRHLAKSACYKAITGDPVSDRSGDPVSDRGHFENFRYYNIERAGITWRYSNKPGWAPLTALPEPE